MVSLTRPFSNASLKGLCSRHPTATPVIRCLPAIEEFHSRRGIDVLINDGGPYRARRRSGFSRKARGLCPSCGAKQAAIDEPKYPHRLHSSLGYLSPMDFERFQAEVSEFDKWLGGS